MDYGQGEIDIGASAPGAYEPVARDRTGRLPAGGDGRALLGFATLSHSNLKSWAKVQAAEGHNTRAKNTPNARKDAPQPIELLDDRSGPYIERVKAILRKHKVPQRIRKNGTIACEDVFGASPEYWNRDGDWKLKSVDEIKNDPVVQAAHALARRKYGAHLVSCSLHLDEQSPHIHVIWVPLVQREHTKRGRKPKDTPRDESGKPLEDSRAKVLKWSLDVSSIRGRSSDLEKNHDEWAEVCRPFGLTRGAKGSAMTEEQRRARRNRQTGRSSMAEMEARAEREHLHENAERSRKRAADLEKSAAAKDEQAEADRLATKLEREAAEASAEKARELEEENRRLRAALDEREAELAKKESKAERETEAHNAQLRFVDRALDPGSDLEIRLGELYPELDGLDDQDRKAIKSSWNWFTGGLGGLVDRIARLVDREASIDDREKLAEATLAEAQRLQAAATLERKEIETDRAQHQSQVEILQKVLQPGADIRFEMDGAEAKIVGFDDSENAALSSSSSWFKKAFSGIVRRLRTLDRRETTLESQLASFAAREAKVSAREGAVTKREIEANVQLAALEEDQGNLDAAWGAINRTLERTMNFLAAWKEIPQEERTPAVDRAIGAATQLSLSR